jgi:hypothetical protein
MQFELLIDVCLRHQLLLDVWWAAHPWQMAISSRSLQDRRFPASVAAAPPVTNA